MVTLPGSPPKVVMLSRTHSKIAIHVEPMIVIHDHCIVIAGKTFAVVGKKIMTAAGGKSSAVHVDHDWALMGGIDLRRPYIHTQAVFAGNGGGRAAMQHERIF